MLQSKCCTLCGATKASGWAFINSDRYCHGDSIIPSCYEEACWSIEAGLLGDWLDDDPTESMKKRKEEYK